MRKVMCFGTFDLLHLGHLHYLQQAKKYGDYLIVIIARDKTKKIQKKPIIFNEKERQHLLQSLKVVDKAVLGNYDNHLKIILQHKPDILCLGYDHKITISKLKGQLAKHHLHPLIKRISAYNPMRQKSTKLKQKILRL
jgi:FAD synthetase